DFFPMARRISVPVIVTGTVAPCAPRFGAQEGTERMTSSPAPLPAVPVIDKRCPDRIEVNPDDPVVSAAMVKAWVAHLRAHGWTEKDLGLLWLTRARHGVTREAPGEGSFRPDPCGDGLPSRQT